MFLFLLCLFFVSRCFLFFSLFSLFVLNHNIRFVYVFFFFVVAAAVAVLFFALVSCCLLMFGYQSKTSFEILEISKTPNMKMHKKNAHLDKSS